MKSKKTTVAIEIENKYHAPALDKGLDILEYLSGQTLPQSQTEISQALDKSPNEIYRMLVCLESRGYIIRDDRSSKYRLSLKLYHLSHGHNPTDILRRAAQSPMEELTQVIRQSCHLSVQYLEEVMVLVHAQSPEPIALSVKEGNLFSLLQTASGNVILAFMPEEERSRFLKSNHAFLQLPQKQQTFLLTSLTKIKEQGFYIMPSNLADGIVDIALPIGKTPAGIMACLTVSSLVKPSADKEQHSLKILDEAMKCAQKMEKRMGLNSTEPAAKK